MSIQNSIKERLQEQFINAKLQGTADLAIRDGHYFIKSVDYKEFRNKGKLPIAVVVWKTSANTAFIKEVEFQVSLSALSLEPYYDYINLVNKVIVVTNTRLDQRKKDGKDVSVILCDHYIERATPTFETLMDIALSTFMGNANTVSEAYNTFQANLGIDLTEFLEIEATPEEVYDEPNDEIVSENTHTA